MRWLSWLCERSDRDSLDGSRDIFVSGAWEQYFGSLTPEGRRAASVRLCQKVLATVSLEQETMERALAALAEGPATAELFESVRLTVERSEGDYDRLVGEDDSRLSGADPAIAKAFVRARAATSLLCALEGDLTEMAYEASFVLNDLDEVRRLVGVPVSRE